MRYYDTAAFVRCVLCYSAAVSAGVLMLSFSIALSVRVMSWVLP